jgi:hypothetical protein
MFLTKKHLPRRTFLRGVGATIALPLLDSMIPARTALAQTAAKPALRAGFVYIPMGAQIPQWTPIGDKPGFKYSRILKPIEQFRDRVTVVSGTSLIAENGHTLSNAMWLNGTKPAHGTVILSGTTIDQIIAQKIGQETSFPSLEIATEDHSSELGSCGGDYECSYMNTISWRTPTTPNPMELNPRVLFERMFGGDGSTAAQRVARLHDDLSILDGVTQSVNDLSKGLDSKDKSRLSDYMENLREIERRIAKVEKQNSQSTELGAPDAPVGIPDSFDEHATLLFDLWAIAFQADISRVVSFMLARELSTRTYPQIGVPDGHHPVSHHQNDPVKKEQQARINVHHMEMFARFLTKLNNMPAGDGNMLDHSMILYGSGMSNSNVHAHDQLPILIAGGGAGRLKGDRHIKVANDTPLSNLLVGMLEVSGIHSNHLGDSSGRIEL